MSREDVAERQRAFLQALVANEGVHDGVAPERLAALRETLQRKAARRALHEHAHTRPTGWVRKVLRALRRVRL